MKRFIVEKMGRSVTKAITFRLLVLVSNTVIIYLLTRRLDLTFGVTLFATITNTLLYIFHERIWQRTSWGLHH